MKVNFNQTTQINNISSIRFDSIQRGNKITSSFGVHFADKPQVDTFENVAFQSSRKKIINPDKEFLEAQTKILPCFFSGYYLIDKKTANEAYEKLARKYSNAESAVNYLQQYAPKMFPVERQAFNVFKEAEYKGKRGFQEILDSMVPESLENIKQKQITILDCTEDTLEGLLRRDVQEVLNLRDRAINAVVDGSFSRREFLEELLYILPKGGDQSEFSEVYKLWHKLPSTFTDFDAFVLRYHNTEHAKIARNLISPSEQSTDHLTAQSRKGPDKGSNYVMAASIINDKKGSMTVSQIDELYPEWQIRKNIQNYIDIFVRAINKGIKSFVTKSWYPEAIQNRVSIETGGEFIPKIGPINISKAQRLQNNFSSRLSTRYRVFHK